MLAGLVAQAEGRGGDLVTIRALVEEASEIGAGRALDRLGLSDRAAEDDVRELRELLSAWRDAKAAAKNAIIGWVVRRRQAAQASQGPTGASFAFQGAGPAAATPTPVSYRPENVGNDASARPWERSSMAFEAGKVPGASGSMIGSALAGSQNWGVPEGFDTEGFLRSAKANFITLQAAWDRSDIPALRAMMTDEMLGEIRTQLAEREATTGTPGNHTDVVMLEAKLLGIEDSAAEYLASVEFSGMIREDASAGPGPFREVWNMTKPKDGRSGWLVAGVQALQ